MNQCADVSLPAKHPHTNAHRLSFPALCSLFAQRAPGSLFWSGSAVLGLGSLAQLRLRGRQRVEHRQHDIGAEEQRRLLQQL
jgi:hypothetical protein